MSETATVALPAVPLEGAVLLPGTVVTVTLDDSNRAAVTTAAARSDRRIVLVPQVEGRPATVGVITQVENVGQLPGGGDAAILRTLQRARLGATITVERSGDLVGVEPLQDARPSPRVEAQARELRV